MSRSKPLFTTLGTAPLATLRFVPGTFSHPQRFARRRLFARGVQTRSH
jgi:hypothetical protein